MADNVQVSQGTGTAMATDDVGGVHYPRVKLSVGADGSATDVSSANPIPSNDVDANAKLASIDGKLPTLSGGRVPVDIGGSGSITITSGTITVSNEVEITNDVGSPIPVSGTVTANTGLSQPLTDAQLRAVAVPVSGTVTANTGLSQPLTDAQLRATTLPVSVSGVSTAVNQTSQLTELQAIKTAVEILDNAIAGNEMQVDVVSSALPTGAATEAKQDTGNTSLASIDTKLPSGLTVTGSRLQVDLPTGSIGLTDAELRAAPVPVSGTVTANTGLSQPLTDAQLRAVAVPVSGPVTDAQLRASAVPVSVSGVATEAKQDTGNTSLSSIDGKITACNTGAVTISAALPAGTNLIGKTGYRLVKVSANFTRPSDTTAYATGDAVTNSTSAPTVFQLDLGALGAVNGQGIEVRRLAVVSSVKQSTLPLFNVFLSHITFTATNDNAALDIVDATMQANGAWFPCDVQNYTASNSRVDYLSTPQAMVLDAADTKLYGTIQAANAYTPVSGEVFYILAWVALL